MEREKHIYWPGWETVRLIGRGSFGAVYEIQRDVFGEVEKAALKVISIPQNDSDIREMFADGYDEESITSTFEGHLKNIVTEYSLMRKMNGSSNVVNCDDFRYVQHDDGYGWDIYIKMELLTPLPDALPYVITDELAIRVTKDMCAALELCSKYNIVHRDIKPQNIFVSKNGDYKLGDFGIAKTVEKTMGGTKTGTYKYMAPEVFHNKPYNSTADIYSLGLVLYWLLNERRMPFMPLPPEKLRAGMDEESRNRRFAGEPLPAPKNGSEELKAIVLKACAYDPRERYQSAREMLQELTALENGTALNIVHENAPQKAETVPAYTSEAAEEPDNGTMTVGPVWRSAPVDESGTTGGTVGPVWDKGPVNSSEATERTAGPVFAPRRPQEEPQWQRVQQKQAQKQTSGEKMQISHIVAFFLVLMITLACAVWLLRNTQDITLSDSKTSYQTSQRDDEDAATTRPPKAQSTEPVGTVPPNTIPDETTPRDLTAKIMAQTDCIAAGGLQSVVILPDGTALATGDSTYGSCNVQGWKNLIAVSSGDYFTVGLRKDGTVLATGDNQYGQCNVSEWSGIIAIAAGDFHTVGLKKDGTVVATGDNRYGQCNVAALNFGKEIIAVAASWDHTVVLYADGTAAATGDNTYGECNVSGWRDIVAIYAGANFTVGLRSDRTVVATGNNDAGQCNVAGWSDVIMLSAGDYHTVAVTTEGSILSTGMNTYGQQDFSDWGHVVAIGAGCYHTVAILADGRIVAVGRNQVGQCNISQYSYLN